jgi:F-type H+-transporting ATPase subunit alpha
VRPAINVGISVSRVGGSAQIKAMRSVAGRLRLDLAQYRELEAFASFSSDLDAASRATLERGQRLVELLKQGQYSPYPVEREVVAIWLGTTGKLDRVPVSDVRRFEGEFLDYIGRGDNGIYDEIRTSKQLGDDAVSSLERAVDAFYGEFQTSDGSSLVQQDDAEAMDASERGQETVQVKRG